MNLIAKPSKKNIKTYLPIGTTLLLLSFSDVFINAFFSYNLLGFFPNIISYFLQVYDMYYRNKTMWIGCLKLAL